MKLQEIFDEINSSFDGLWRTKQRGSTLEIITPYSTTNNKFVSVFISKQGNDFILSDGGWINSGVYETFMSEEICFLKVVSHFEMSFDIKQVTNKEGSIYYYVKTSNAIDVPSRLFDLSLFIQNIVSVSEIEFENKEEKESKQRFVTKANEFIKSFAQKEKLRLNAFLIPNKKDIKFNAIYNNTNSNISLFNYITGSSNFYFSNSISKTNMLFEMAEETALRNHLIAKVSIIDTSADGYSPNKVSSYLNHLEQKTGSVLISWHEKERLEPYFK